ncbi:MAG: hypothetical protein ACI8V4_003476, partial [Ilumatobacter sp.]
DVELLFDRLTAQRSTESLDSAVVSASAIDGELSDGLDALEGVVAGLPAHDLAKQAAQQPDVVTELIAARRVEVAGD